MMYLFVSSMIFLFLIGQWNERRSQRGREHERAVVRSFKGREPDITNDGPESQEHREWRERYNAVWREAFLNPIPRSQKVAWWAGGIVGIPALAVALAIFNERSFGPTWADTPHAITNGEILVVAIFLIAGYITLDARLRAIRQAHDADHDEEAQP